MTFPQGFELRPYQKEAVDFLSESPDKYPSGYLCDAMGVGKTVTAIVLDLKRREQTNTPNPKTLVIAPLSGVVDSWVRHYRWITNLNVKRIDPKKRDQLYKMKASIGESDPDVFVVHHEACRPKLMGDWLARPYLQYGATKDSEGLKRTFKWTHVIVDEAHGFKNRKAQRTKGLQRIKDVEFKLAMTGTPVINVPYEMQQILYWLYRNEKEWRSFWRFYNKYTEYIEATNSDGEPLGYHIILGPKNTEELRSKIKPFYIRRKKEDVLTDLPEKYFTPIEVELSPKERKPYNEMKREMLAWIETQEDQEVPVAAPIVVAQLQRLQQFACGYADVNAAGQVRIGKPSTKLNVLMDIITGTDEQIVVFSQFKQFIKLLESELKESSISYKLLTGDTPQKFRGGIIRDFLDKRFRVFGATIKAGGVGIDLYSSSTCVFVDRDWSPAINDQAEDRLHRSGQKNAVNIIDLIAKDTVDLGKKQRLEKKWSWIKEVLGE